MQVSICSLEGYEGSPPVNEGAVVVQANVLQERKNYDDNQVHKK